jgi:hypothetical protein
MLLDARRFPIQAGSTDAEAGNGKPRPRQRGDVDEHTFEITFLEPGVEACVFTFG